jgi:hypothetical protein
LRLAREAQERIQNSYDKRLAQLKEDEELTALAEALQTATANMNHWDEEVRLQAVAAYEKTGSKRVHPAVTVKVNRVVEIHATGTTLLNYVKKHLPGALKVNVTLLKRWVRSMDGVGDVPASIATIEPTPSANISRTLKADYNLD